jgi:polyisoprenyl-teichoic acid--peptidoglycan teichoic acid transferase
VRRAVAIPLLLLGGLVTWVAGGALLADPPSVRAQTETPTAAEVGHAGRAEFVPGFPQKGPIFVLVIGSDARPGYCEPAEECLADSLHLIGINPQRRAATILGIPRDSYVDIPGQGQAKLNEALLDGGPQLVVEAVEAVARVDIDYYFLTAFEGFRHMVNDVGGFQVEIPYAIAGSGSLPSLSPGLQELDGELALALARNRKGVPNGDFSRSENQGRLLVAALQQLRKDFRKDPLSLFSWLIAGMTSIQTDLPWSDMFELALASVTIEPNRVVNRVTPGGISMAGEASIVALGSDAEAVFDDIADDGLLEPSES